MKLALQIDYTWPEEPARLGPTLAEIAQAAERCGFASITVPDHVWPQPPWMGSPPVLRDAGVPRRQHLAH